MSQIQALGALLNSSPLEEKWFTAWFDNPDEGRAQKTRHDMAMRTARNRANSEAEAELRAAVSSRSGARRS